MKIATSIMTFGNRAIDTMDLRDTEHGNLRLRPDSPIGSVGAREGSHTWEDDQP